MEEVQLEKNKSGREQIPENSNLRLDNRREGRGEGGRKEEENGLP